MMMWLLQWVGPLVDSAYQRAWARGKKQTLGGIGVAGTLWTALNLIEQQAGCDLGQVKPVVIAIAIMQGLAATDANQTIQPAVGTTPDPPPPSDIMPESIDRT